MKNFNKKLTKSEFDPSTLREMAYDHIREAQTQPKEGSGASPCSAGDYIIVKNKDGKNSSVTSPNHIGATAGELVREAYETAKKIGGRVVIIPKQND